MRKTQQASLLTISLFAFTLAATAQTTTNDGSSTRISIDTTTKSETGGERIYESVEIEASVNAQQWRQHLENNLQKPIEKAARKGMKVGQYMVMVRFLVGLDGSITDVKALNDPGYGLAEASVKVVQTGPKWTPGIYKGRKVRSYHTQPLTFVISDK